MPGFGKYILPPNRSGKPLKWDYAPKMIDILQRTLPG
jgi:hypothetical protein